MKKIIATIIFLIVALTSSVARSERPGRVTPLNAGDIAPYEGLLLDGEAVATIVTERERLREGLQYEVERVKKEIAADARFILEQKHAEYERMNALERARATAAEKEAKRQKEEADKKYSFPWLFASGGSGAVVGLLLALLL